MVRSPRVEEGNRRVGRQDPPDGHRLRMEAQSRTASRTVTAIQDPGSEEEAQRDPPPPPSPSAGGPLESEGITKSASPSPLPP